MRPRGWLICFLAIMPFATLRAAEGKHETGNVQIDHIPIAFAEAGKSIPIEASLQTPGRGLVYLRVYYRSAGQTSFRHSEMRPGPRGYVGEIPASVMKPPSLQYFLLALTTEQAVISIPSYNPYGQPFEILVNTASSATPRTNAPAQQAQPSTEPPTTEAPKSISPQLLEKLRQLESPMAEAEETTPTSSAIASNDAPILILSPEPMSTVAAKEVLISASFDPSLELEPGSIQIMLNGNDITEQADVSTFLVSFNPGQMRGGEYVVEIVAEEKSGKQVGPVSWRFQVQGGANEESFDPAEKRRLASGVVFADAQHEKFNGAPFDNNSLGGNLEGQNGLLSYRADLYLTSLEDRAFQPRHRFALTAGVPMFTITLGDAIPYLNDLVLWGRRVRGVQARFYTGWVNLDFITGQSVRSVTPIYIIVTDTTGKKSLVFPRRGVFDQSLWAVRPSFGGKSFQLGFTLMKATDDINSIVADSAGTDPKGNLVLGSDVVLALLRNRIRFKASVAHALVTNNTRLPILSKDSLASKYNVDLPFDPTSLKSWIVLNESLTPLDPTGGSGLAYQMGVELNSFGHFINVGFKQIGGQYISFGHSFLRKDIRGFYVNDRWRMLNNRLFLNAGFERYRDHFDAIDGNPSTVLNTIQFGVAVNWAPGLPSLNFNFRNHGRDNNFEIPDTTLIVRNTMGVLDTTLSISDRRENNRTHDLSFIINQEVQALNLQHTISLGVTGSARVDRFGGTRMAGIPASDIVSNLQSITIRSRFQMPLITTLAFATNKNQAGGQLAPFKYNSLNAQAEYTFPRPSLRVYAGLRFVKASAKYGAATDTTITVIDYAQTGLQVGGSIIFNKQHEFVLDFGLLKYNDAGGKLNVPRAILKRNPSFTNAFVRSHYEFRF